MDKYEGAKIAWWRKDHLILGNQNREKVLRPRKPTLNSNYFIIKKLAHRGTVFPHEAGFALLKIIE